MNAQVYIVIASHTCTEKIIKCAHTRIYMLNMMFNDTIILKMTYFSYFSHKIQEMNFFSSNPLQKIFGTHEMIVFFRNDTDRTVHAKYDVQ